MFSICRCFSEYIRMIQLVGSVSKKYPHSQKWLQLNKSQALWGSLLQEEDEVKLEVVSSCRRVVKNADVYCNHFRKGACFMLLVPPVLSLLGQYTSALTPLGFQGLFRNQMKHKVQVREVILSRSL